MADSSSPLVQQHLLPGFSDSALATLEALIRLSGQLSVYRDCGLERCFVRLCLWFGTGLGWRFFIWFRFCFCSGLILRFGGRLWFGFVWFYGFSFSGDTKLDM